MEQPNNSEKTQNPSEAEFAASPVFSPSSLMTTLGTGYPMSPGDAEELIRASYNLSSMGAMTPGEVLESLKSILEWDYRMRLRVEQEVHTKVEQPDEPYLGLATTRQLLVELSARMKNTQNSIEGSRLGDLCLEATRNLDRGVLDYRTVDY